MNEVVKKQNTDIAVFSDAEFSAVQATQNISRRDILIPKLLIMQGQSPRVLEGEAAFGEMRDSLNWEVHAATAQGKKEAKNLIALPFHWEKFWIMKKEVQANKWATETVVKMDASNENDDQYRTFQGADGLLRKRVYLHMFYVLIPGKPIPYTIGFRGSSKIAGDALVTQMYVVNKSLNADAAWKKSPMAKFISVGLKKETKNDNTYCYYEVTPDRDATLEEACNALKWYKSVATGEVKAEVEAFAKEDSDF